MLMNRVMKLQAVDPGATALKLQAQKGQLSQLVGIAIESGGNDGVYPFGDFKQHGFEPREGLVGVTRHSHNFHNRDLFHLTGAQTVLLLNLCSQAMQLGRIVTYINERTAVSPRRSISHGNHLYSDYTIRKEKKQDPIAEYLFKIVE